jgi:diaminohydroxyphosphoribosylaminopyrimidine deaminase/5-amino-6-(5-phosphoribosylamino)uracil reductase
MSQMAAFSQQDAVWMAKALSLAEQGRFSTTPNPCVGCVIVSQSGELVGQGYHIIAGTAHAEVHALDQAGKRAKGATAYVTLEPCSHFGRTPPCAAALVDAGIKRVVIAALDTNPLVSGKGMQTLKDAGIDVSHGLMASSANELNRGFNTRMSTGRPFVILKMAASLDGKTALQNGLSQWISSPQARKDVQLERAKACAILSGSGTVLADDPQLNVRSAELPEHVASAFLQRQRQPLRVIIDGKNQLHNELRVIKDGQDTLVYNLQPNQKLHGEKVTQVSQTPLSSDTHVDLAAMLDELGKRQINQVWVEAGSKLAGALIENQLVDECVLYLAPKFLGSGAKELLSTQVHEHLGQAITGHISSLTQIGDDIKIVCRFPQKISA